MKVRRLNRVELLLPGDDITAAALLFNELLGGHLPPPEKVPGQQVISTVDYALGIEFFGPSDPDSPRASVFEHKPRRGAIGPLVWEVDDLEQLFGYGVTFTERRTVRIR